MNGDRRPIHELASDSKLFKRSSFHVAIAYHIHIRKLKESGKELTGANDIDPTYKARKMREEKNREEDSEISHTPEKQETPPKD